MLRLICMAAMLSLFIGLEGCCMSTHNATGSVARSESPDMDKRVKIVFGHWANTPDLWMEPGPVFMWQGRLMVSEDLFCRIIRDTTAMVNHADMFIAIDGVSDSSVRELIGKLGRLQQLSHENLAPNATLTLCVEFGVSPETISTTRSSPATEKAPE